MGEGTGSRAKDAAVNEAVSVLVYFGVVGAVSLLILKRYYLAGWWQQVTAKRMTPDQARIEREVADFRRELGSLNHPAGKKRHRGLYERP